MSSSSSTPVWLITGASSGFGEAIAHEALSRGHHVVATARSSARLGALRDRGAAVLDLDVTSDDAALAGVFREAHAVHGRITHVVNCAGYILEGTVEEASAKEVFDIFNTNVLGTANVARAAAPYLREAAKARPGQKTALATFGSLGSWWSGPAVAHYCSTKFAVSGLTEGLAEELRPFGVTVCCFEPGYTRTGFLRTGGGGGGADHRVRTARQLDVYHGTEAAKMRGAMDAYDGNQPGDVNKCATVIVDVLTGEGVASGRDVPVRLLLGSDSVDVVRAKLEATLETIKAWEEVSASTTKEG